MFLYLRRTFFLFRTLNGRRHARATYTTLTAGSGKDCATQQTMANWTEFQLLKMEYVHCYVCLFVAGVTKFRWSPYKGAWSMPRHGNLHYSDSRQWQGLCYTVNNDHLNRISSIEHNIEFFVCLFVAGRTQFCILWAPSKGYSLPVTVHTVNLLSRYPQLNDLQ